MTDETTPKSQFRLTVSDHPKVSASLFAGALTNLILALAKAKWGLDLSGLTGDFTVVIMATVGYLVPGAQT